MKPGAAAVTLIAMVGIGLFIALRLIHWYRFLREFWLAQISAKELK
jgi:TM2 domain-containing membrane protein YozV